MENLCYKVHARYGIVAAFLIEDDAREYLALNDPTGTNGYEIKVSK